MKNEELKKAFGWLILFFCFISCQQPKQYYAYNGQLHTPFHIKYEYNEPLDEEIKAELDRFYRLFNVFDSTSVLSQINRNELEVVEDSTLLTALHTALTLSAYTNGAYDITAAPLINLWGFGFSKQDSVTPAHIDSIQQFVGYRKLHLEGNHIQKDDARMSLNCSSLADGTVCDMIADLFDRHGISNYMVEFGGEIVSKGINQRGEYWRLGITRPTDDASGLNQSLQATIHLKGARRGMATSGNYRNFYLKEGKKYAHTIDPRAGTPIQRDVLSATVIAPTGQLADACATACMVLGSDSAAVLKQRLPEIEYFLICSGDSAEYKYVESEGFKDYLIQLKE